MRTPRGRLFVMGVAALALVTVGCGDDDGSQADAAAQPDSAGQPDAAAQQDAAAQPDADVTDPFAVTERVEVVTSMGTFVVNLYGNGAPNTVTNFLHYVDADRYTDIIFHRVIPDFMIQGGGLYADMSGAQTLAPIDLEIMDGLNHVPGVISMARTSDPNSATNQFFICVATVASLDGQYAAFGEVETGYDVVQSISLVTTQTVGSYDDVPVTPVVIQSMTRLGPP